jgi:hypothetical protein
MSSISSDVTPTNMVFLSTLISGTAPPSSWGYPRTSPTKFLLGKKCDSSVDLEVDLREND